jgi:ribosomal subunit interface protein
MDITFKGRHTSVPERFRRHASVKLTKLEKLDHKAIRIDVEVSKEPNPRQSDRSERVELTIRSKGPAVRAEAAADDQYVALDLAFAKLEARLRRASERRKARKADMSIRTVDAVTAVTVPPGGRAATAVGAAGTAEGPGDIAAPSGAAVVDEARRGRKGNGRPRPETVVRLPAMPDDADYAGAQDEADVEAAASGLVPIQMEGDGPLVVREKFHASHPMTIDQALLEMELVGHDFYAFHDSGCDKFSVVYRRRGYNYGVIRLVEDNPEH